MNTLPQYEADDGPLSSAQIKQLAEKAGIYIAYDNRAALDKELEFFAELIVKECLTIIEYEANGYAEPVWAYEIVNDIKERFDMATHLE